MTRTSDRQGPDQRSQGRGRGCSLAVLRRPAAAASRGGSLHCGRSSAPDFVVKLRMLVRLGVVVGLGAGTDHRFGRSKMERRKQLIVDKILE